MSQDTKNLKTAAKLFKRMALSIGVESTKEELRKFLQGYEEGYSEWKVTFVRLRGRQESSFKLKTNINNCLSIMEYAIPGGINREPLAKRSAYLGRFFGGLLALVEYGLTSPLLNKVETQYLDKGFQRRVLSTARTVGSQLKTLGMGINESFIQERCNAILTERLAEMSNEQRVFFLAFAEYFKN